MHLTDFIRKIEERFPDCKLGEGASLDDLSLTESRLGVSFPDQVREFYQCCNGLRSASPYLNILPLSELEPPDSRGCLIFCYADEDEPIAFDTTETNDADQWFIVGLTEGYQITFTMASFWSNKIWKWLEHQRVFWSSSEYEES